ncbi:MAG: chromosomal replication initiator protein DnaA [Beijerinckiaceae bacterium]
MYSKTSDLNGDAPGYVARGAHLVDAGSQAERGRQAWTRIQSRLRAELGEDVYNSWFARMELADVHDGAASLSVPTKFLKSWVSAHYRDRLKRLFVEAECGIDDVHLLVRVAGQKSASQAAPERRQDMASVAAAAATSSPPENAPSTADPAAAGLAGSPLDRRYTFQNFLVGQSNAFAHAAAQQVARARAGDKPIYNPLYLHAAVGLGKTHLCQALAQDLEGGGRRIVYLTAEKFMYGFVAALKAQNAIAFKEKLRAIDVLVIDDVQFLTGKSIQQEFCHTLNALLDAGKQVIIAADRAPCDLESVEERMRSRLQAGLVIEMGALDEALRVKILEARIAAARSHFSGFEVRPEVTTWLARQLTANGRDLEGAVNRMLAHATLSGETIDLPTAEIAIKDLIRTREPKKVKIEDIQRLVANHYNVSKADILSSRRTATVVKPRQIAMYLSKALTLRSLPEIGRRFGGRDHTTVLHAVRKIEGLANEDVALAGEIDLLKRMLQE